jgi:hypothetical protein
MVYFLSIQSAPLVKHAKPFIKKERLHSEQCHSSDRDMKTRVFAATFGQYKNKNCNTTCSNGGKCLENAGLDRIHELQIRFWGGTFDKPPTTSERSVKIANILKAAFIPATSTFKFSLGIETRIEVCEKSFLRALGLLSTESELSTSQWRRQKKALLGESFDELTKQGLFNELTNQEKYLIHNRAGRKNEMIMSFIEEYVKDHCDVIDTLNDDNPDEMVVKHVLPFGSVDSFYEEFLMQKHSEGCDNVADYGCGRTFRRSYDKVGELPVCLYVITSVFI